MASDPNNRDPKNPNIFINPWSTYEDRSFRDVWRWHREKRAAGLPSTGHLRDTPNPTPADFAAALPVLDVDWDAINTPPAEGTIRCTWVGHSTLLVQMGSCNILTDPVFSARASPVQFAGPQRVTRPAFDASHPRLPQVHAVVLSHNHYDHLDVGSVRALHTRFDDALRWYVPLGLLRWFRGQRVLSVTELDWWQTRDHPGTSLQVTLVPAQHWSTRTTLDKNRSLWGGYVLSVGKTRFYFAGDSGYCSAFAEVGRRFGPIALSAIPIGAYAPRWFMRPQHINPAEAVQVHRDVQSQASIGIHWGTFCLTDEPMDEPPILLREEVCGGASVAVAHTFAHNRWQRWEGTRRRFWRSTLARR